MQRQTALVVAAVAVSAPLLAVGGLAVAADHVHLGPATTETTQVGSTGGQAGGRSGTPAQADNSWQDTGSSSQNGGTPRAEDYWDDDCAFESDHGTELHSDDCAFSATAEPGSHHDDDAYEDETYDDD
jgi:hypothetical protein